MYELTTTSSASESASSSGGAGGSTLQGTKVRTGLENAALRGGSARSESDDRLGFLRTGTREVLRAMIDSRAERRKFLPAHLFTDPAWDMLLDLYQADLLSKQISVSSLCGATNASATTGLRWIATLEQEGLVNRISDRFDGRRHFISLSATGLACMDGFFESLARKSAQQVERSKSTDWSTNLASGPERSASRTH